MGLIQEEFKESEQFKFDMLTKDLVKINRKNVAFVEAMIRNDSAYLKSFNKDAKPTYTKKNNLKYPGSSAYWITKVKELIFDEKCPADYYNTMKNVVSAIDRENSTHLNSDLVGIDEITDRIVEIDRAVLIDYLKNPAEDFKLIQIISKPTKPKDKKHKPRTNYSFATKFCHYMSFYLFEDNEQDNFSIFDGVMLKAIMKYADHYKIKNKNKKFKKADLEDYKTFYNLVDEVRSLADEKVSRNGLDHLLWYYYKGRI